MESEKGTKLEWIIILLIAVEIVIGSLSLSLDYAAKRERYLAAAGVDKVDGGVQEQGRGMRSIE